MMKRALIALGGVVWALVLTGCPGPECTTNTDCETGFICQAEKCVVDPTPARCDNGRITCQTGQVCDTAGDGKCKSCTAPNNGCASDEFCDPTGASGMGVCLICSASQGCDGATPICDEAAGGGKGACVTCREGIGCLVGGATHCDEAANSGAGLCVGCRDSADCSGSTPLCDPSTNTCKGCLDNTNCTDPSKPVCDPAGSGVCRTCTATDGCSGATPACDTSAAGGMGVCVECVSSTDCSTSGSTVCRTSDHTCVTCLSNEGCTTPTAACDTSAAGGEGACVECVDNTTCGGGTPNCDTATKACKTCLADNTGCSGNTPICDVAANGGAGACVECTSNTQCTVGAETQCDLTSNTCKACYLDGATSVGCPGAQVCDTTANGGSGQCLGCLGDTDCVAPTGKCKTPPGACVECIGNTDCTDATRPACNAANACGCASSADCAASTGTTECNTAKNGGVGACVTCLSGTNTGCDPASATPFCNAAETACVTCLDNGDCSAVQECDTAGACVAPATAPADTSTQINAFLAAAAGTFATPLPIQGALVTYLKPASGEKAGFFVQAEQTGPAMFVEVDPATVPGAPMVGDRINFEAVTKTIVNSVDTATVIQNLVVVSSGHPIWSTTTGLLQDVSAATDLVTGLNNYESEILTVVGDIPAAATFSGGGTSHSQINFTTAGMPTSSTSNRLRINNEMLQTTDIAPGCHVTVHQAPMWRFNTTAQISPEYASDITLGTGCPAPATSSAMAGSSTTVVVEFTRRIDAASVDSNGSDFSITDGTNPLAVTGAALDPLNARRVIVTTATQAVGTRYTLTVNTGSVTDQQGTATTATGTASFWGYAGAATGLVLNELDPDQAGADAAEFVEIFNPGSSPVHIGAVVLYLGNGNDANGSRPYLTVPLADAVDSTGARVDVIPAGGYLVVGNAAVFAAPTMTTTTVRVTWAGANTIQNGPDGVALVESTTGTLLDAAFYLDAAGTGPINGTSFTVPSLAGDKLFSFREGATPVAADSNTVTVSLQRTPNGTDTDTNSADFTNTKAPSPGAATP